MTDRVQDKSETLAAFYSRKYVSLKKRMKEGLVAE